MATETLIQPDHRIDTTSTISKRTGWLLFLLLAAIFLFCNRGAYHGYFQDDEINAMSWTRFGSSSAFLKGALQPLYKYCFRAVGFYFFHVTEHWFGLDFPKYVAAIQALHLLNVWMLWLLLRRLGAHLAAATFAVGFFGLHTAFFDAVWKPAFIFDLLCATLCLASTLLWMRGRWITSFVLFWLAYQSKELAVMLPLVLVCYEYWFGKRRWTRLAPFLAASFSFAFQALVLFPNPPGDYSFHFTPASLADTLSYYSGRVFLIPLVGLLLPVAIFRAGNRRTWFGLASMLLYFVPLLFLPGRIESSYCYLPFTGLAVALAGVAETRKKIEIAAFLVLWLPLDIYWLTVQAGDTLRRDDDIRAWMANAKEFAKSRPDVTDFAFDDAPEGFRPFGMKAVFQYFTGRKINMAALDSPEGAKITQGSHAAILRWIPARHRLEIEAPKF